MKTKKKIKTPKIKTLETKVWNECRRIIRARYDGVCVSCGKEVSGKGQHTGHYFRKKFIPLRCKYLLDNLRVQCSYCNLRLHGNIENYTVFLLKENKFDIVGFREKIDLFKSEKFTVEQDRDYLTKLLGVYKTIDN